MHRRICVMLLLAAIHSAFAANHNWDMAVAIEDKVELLDNNATLVGLTYQVFKNLKAITFDDIRHQFIVSDMEQENDTIFRIRLSDTKNAVPIVADIPDDVKDVAVDPVDDVLYWTDSLHKKIMMLPLNDLEAKSQVLFAFKDEIPQGIAIDSCRRKIYWTNANHPMATIERANLDGTEREIIVKGNMFMPTGITIDQGSRKIYWADMGEGIYFQIESAKLDGSARRIVYEDTHQRPFGIAVSDTSIYWTDINNYALWGMKKDDTGLKPEIVRNFSQKPMGIVTRNHDYLNIPECQEVVEAINGYNGSSKELIVTAEDSEQCLNYGELTPFGCKCGRGFTGPRCEINQCHNLCVNGLCYFSSQGYPKCKCPIGYMGERCEHEMCRDFCLNGGTCKMSLSNGTRPKCQCPVGFSGQRCERLIDPHTLCDCEDGILIFPVNGEKPICRCQSEESSTYRPVADNLRSDSEFMNRLRDPLMMAFVFATVFSVLVITMLTILICKMRHRRPRIKKRIIVNKNVTPLTCRPNPPTEQCEITIENCCNMNICETPCFEPSQIRAFQRTKTEEKKTLLTSMENGEDLY